MKKNYNVSIIVPVYNAEEYLDDCIKSVINQTYGFSNIELVLVNDGSKDNSLKKCNEYKAKYDNMSSLEDIEKIFSCSKTTAIRKLNHYVEMEILKQIDNGNKTYYELIIQK